MSCRVFLNSLPKSGTNLLARTLELMGCHQFGNVDASLVKDRRLRSLPRKFRYAPLLASGYLVGIDTPVCVSKRAVNRILDAAGPGDFVTGHVGYTIDLLNMLKSKQYRPLLILRDPRAVLNSFVHYVKVTKGHPLYKLFHDEPLQDSYRRALYGVSNGYTTLQPLVCRCNAVESWRVDEDVLVVRFEDLVGPSGGGRREAQEKALSSIMSFLEIAHTDVRDLARNVFGAHRHTFRKGAIATWKDEMPLVNQKEASELMRDVLERWGYA